MSRVKSHGIDSADEIVPTICAHFGKKEICEDFLDYATPRDTVVEKRRCRRRKKWLMFGDLEILIYFVRK